MASDQPLVLFDMDGTLLDTRYDIARAANGARAELGLDPMAVADVVRAVGDGVNKFVSRVTYSENDPRFPRAKEIFMDHYARNVTGETRPYNGISELLVQLQNERVPMAIVSNKPVALVDELVRYFGWAPYFKTWLGGDSTPKPKPDKAPLVRALMDSGYPANHPLFMVGDGHQDILAAKSMNCTAIWVSWGFNPTPTAEYPSARADHPRDVATYILKLSKSP